MNRELEVENMIKQTILKFADNLQGYKVVLFGSRVTGNFHKHSDFDVGVIGEKSLPVKIFFAIEDAFEKLPTLYKIDWIDFTKVDSSFLEYALKESRVIYE